MELRRKRGIIKEVDVDRGVTTTAQTPFQEGQRVCPDNITVFVMVTGDALTSEAVTLTDHLEYPQIWKYRGNRDPEHETVPSR